MDIKIDHPEGDTGLMPLSLCVPNLDNKKFECNICDKKFNSRTHLNYHLESHSGKKHFLCSFCGKSFSTSSYVKIHGMSQHGIIADVKTYKCLFCDKIFMNKSHHDYHLQTHMGEKPYACDLCDKRFTSKAYLKIHRFRHEEHNPENSNYACARCDKTLINKSHLEYHANSHLGKKVSCTSCDKSFTSEQYLQIHNLKHKNNLNPFDPNTNLSNYLHSLKYKNSLPILGPSSISGFCHICNRFFYTDDDYKKHMEIHAGVKYPCNICKAEFANKELLDAHQKDCSIKN